LVSLICETQFAKTKFVKTWFAGVWWATAKACEYAASVACWMERQLHRPAGFAQVGEWLKPTDCKSVPPSEVRRFESFPVHQIMLSRLAGVSEAGARWRNPERFLRGIWVNYESPGKGFDCVRGYRSFGVCHAKRFSDPLADAFGFGAVRVQELGAA
jgi:hypothetical protein